MASLKVFLSYAKEDLNRVRPIYDYLARHGFEPWLDVVKLLPGNDWELEVTRAIRGCHFFLACMSARAVTKEGFVQKEFKKALEILDEMPEGGVYLIPVLLEPCNVPTRFRRLHYCDSFQPDGLNLLRESLIKASVERGLGSEAQQVLSRDRPAAGAPVKTKRITFHCSFCNKREDAVRRLIAGPVAVFICNECVDLCNEIIAEEFGDSKPA